MSAPAPQAPRVFLSYSHDLPEHADRVPALSDRLREDSIDTILDADWVLRIRTAARYRRVMGEGEPSRGIGVRWEGNLIYRHLYGAGTMNARFLPTPVQGSALPRIGRTLL